MPVYNKSKTARIGDSYYVLANGESQGPYDLPFVQAMVLSEMLPVDVSVSTDGRTGWRRLDSLVPAQEFKPPTNAPPPFPSRPTAPPLPKKKSNKGGLILWGVIGFFVLVGYLNNHPSTPAQTAYQPPAPQVDTSSYQPAPATPAPDYSGIARPAVQPLPVQQYVPAVTPSVQPVAVTQDSTPAAAPSQDTTAQDAITAGSTPVSATPAPIPSAPQPTYQMSDSTGRTFKVSLSDYNVLTQQEAGLTTTMAVINKWKAWRERQKSLIESERPYINDTTDEAQVAAFNKQVDDYNASAASMDHDIDIYNSGVDAHNAYLERVGTPQN